MVEITIVEDKAIFAVQGWDKLWSLRSQLEIPLAHIKDAHPDPHPPMGWFQGLKVGGTDLPNIFRAGTFYQQGEWVFWDVHEPSKTIVIELEHESFGKLIIEVNDPELEVQKIRTHLRGSQV